MISNNALKLSCFYMIYTDFRLIALFFMSHMYDTGRVLMLMYRGLWVIKALDCRSLFRGFASVQCM